MDTASRLAYLVGQYSGRSIVIIIIALVMFTMALAAVALTGGLLQLESEPIIAAPLRW